MKRGFTLIEIVITLGIFGILMLVGTDFFVSTIQSSNRSTIQNEVRQNAQKIMQDIVSQIRQANSYTIIGGKLITSSASGTITYSVDSNGGFFKNGSKINSNLVAILGCGTCAPTCSTTGLNLISNPDGSISIGLTVQQKPGPTRSDFCAVTTLNDTATPRTY